MSRRVGIEHLKKLCVYKKKSLIFFSVILVDWKEASPNICRAFARARMEVYIPHREMFYTDSEGQVKVRNAEVLKRQQYGNTWGVGSYLRRADQSLLFPSLIPLTGAVRDNVERWPIQPTYPGPPYVSTKRHPVVWLIFGNKTGERRTSKLRHFGQRISSSWVLKSWSRRWALPLVRHDFWHPGFLTLWEKHGWRRASVEGLWGSATQSGAWMTHELLVTGPWGNKSFTRM